MIYRNVEIRYPQPERVGKGELAELFGLLVKVGVVVVVVLAALDRLALRLAPLTPFSWEVHLAESLKVHALDALQRHEPDAPALKIQAALQKRVDTLAGAAGFSPTMHLTVHYVASDTVNAFATLGGHIFVFRGLLEKIRYEQELDAVLLHEMGHVYHRDVIRQLSRGVVALGALSAMKISNSAIDRWVLGDANQIALLAHSRDNEKQADDFAIKMIEQRYGSAEGMASLLEILAAQERDRGNDKRFEWLQTHPDTLHRIDAAKAPDAGHVTEHALIPLAEDFHVTQGR